MKPATGRKPPSANPPPRRRRWLRRLLVSLSTMAVLLIASGFAITCKPSWYAPATIDYSRLDQDKADLTNLADRIGGSLNRRQPIEFEVGEDQLNRWIAERHEWPEGDRVELGPIEQPYIDLMDGDRIRIAAMARRAGTGVVASVILRPEIGNDEVVLRWEAVRTGILPAPRGLVEQLVRQRLAPEDAAEVLTPDGDIRVPNEFLWPNGRARYRLKSVSTTDETLRIRLEPR